MAYQITVDIKNASMHTDVKGMVKSMEEFLKVALNGNINSRVEHKSRPVPTIDLKTRRK